MLITLYYCGTSGKLSGLTFDPGNKEFKEFILNKNQWSNGNYKRNSLKPCYIEDTVGPAKLTGFDFAGDIAICLERKMSLDDKKQALKSLGFKENPGMILSFGLFTL